MSGAQKIGDLKRHVSFNEGIERRVGGTKTWAPPERDISTSQTSE